MAAPWAAPPCPPPARFVSAGARLGGVCSLPPQECPALTRVAGISFALPRQGWAHTKPLGGVRASSATTEGRGWGEQVGVEHVEGRHTPPPPTPLHARSALAPVPGGLNRDLGFFSPSRCSFPGPSPSLSPMAPIKAVMLHAPRSFKRLRGLPVLLMPVDSPALKLSQT